MSTSPPPPSDSLIPPTPSPRPVSDMETFKMLSVLLPKVPLAIRVAIMHILRLSAPAPYIDLRSALIVSITRSFLNGPRTMSISAVQKLTLRDPGPKGKIWVSTYASPVPPETALLDALLSSIEDLRDKNGDPPPEDFDIPDVAPVEAEWTGYRANAKSEEPLPQMSEVEKYRAMNDECTSPTTILYLHGGAYYLCDPATHRPTTKKLAELTGGRCYSVRYRLAPQHPFPAALLDALVSYFTLLYPPPDAYHDAVAPEHIVLAGDSAGGNLAFSLMALLLHLHKQGTPIMWHGQPRTVPLPAAVCGNSPWIDLTQSATSWEGSKQVPFDYLPPLGPKTWHDMPPCRFWPANPPRKHVYLPDSLLTHPLATVAMHDSWSSCPPVYISTGWEILGLEGRWFARHLHNSGVKVVFEEYEAMPHVFTAILPKTENAKKCYERTTAFIRQAVKDPEGIDGQACTIKAKGLEVRERQFEDLCCVGDEEFKERIREYAAIEVEFDAKL